MLQSNIHAPQPFLKPFLADLNIISAKRFVVIWTLSQCYLNVCCVRCKQTKIAHFWKEIKTHAKTRVCFRQVLWFLNICNEKLKISEIINFLHSFEMLFNHDCHLNFTKIKVISFNIIQHCCPSKVFSVIRKLIWYFLKLRDSDIQFSLPKYALVLAQKKHFIVKQPVLLKQVWIK